jgi:histidyl-tRNA synthetase
LDYYNGTVFEIWSADENEEILPEEPSLGGGGRYDGLVEHLGGRATPACGVAVGMERIVSKIRSLGIPLENNMPKKIIYLAHLGEQPKRYIFKLFEELRKGGYAVRQSFAKETLKAQLEDADRSGSVLTLILGQKELNDGTILFRDMESGNQEIIDYKKIKQELDKRLNNGL